MNDLYVSLQRCALMNGLTIFSCSHVNHSNSLSHIRLESPACLNSSL